MASASRGRSDRPRDGGRSSFTIESLSSGGPHGRTARVRQRRDFVRIQKHGIRVRTPAFTIAALPGRSTTRARLGCAVSRRVGNAVVRNRVRRLIKETFRRIAHRLGPIDFVVIAKPSAANLRGLDDLVSILVPALERADGKAQRVES